MIVPRGGKNLVARVQAEARVPVFAHLEGICHVYVDKAASLDMAKAIVLNAKMRRTGVCGAAETLLVDRAAAPTHLKPLVAMLIDAGCEVRGDDAVRKPPTRAPSPRREEDWSTEYLDAIISAQVVDGVDAAIEHIERYGSHHTDSIVTEDKAAAEKFLREVDSAIVLHNASTQFADGGEFGFGAEIGIATGRFHARGPVGVEQLTSFKYRVRGSGRPGREQRLRLAGTRDVCLLLTLPGMRIGLFGGTFDPPHQAHRAACLIAMRRLGLDRVWWLVTPGNPLKDTRGLAPARRTHRGRDASSRTTRASRSPASRPRSAPATPTTRSAICDRAARACASSGSWAPTTCAASIAGRTGAASPTWCPSRWSTGSARASTRRQASPPRRLRALPAPGTGGAVAAGRKPPAWVYLHGLKSPLSSTALRARRAGCRNDTDAVKTSQNQAA